jgi:hypothetical protein
LPPSVDIERFELAIRRSKTPRKRDSGKPTLLWVTGNFSRAVFARLPPACLNLNVFHPKKFEEIATVSSILTTKKVRVNRNSTRRYTRRSIAASSSRANMNIGCSTLPPPPRLVNCSTHVTLDEFREQASSGVWGISGSQSRGPVVQTYRGLFNNPAKQD